MGASPSWVRIPLSPLIMNRLFQHMLILEPSVALRRNARKRAILKGRPLRNHLQFPPIFVMIMREASVSCNHIATLPRQTHAHGALRTNRAAPQCSGVGRVRPGGHSSLSIGTHDVRLGFAHGPTFERSPTCHRARVAPRGGHGQASPSAQTATLPKSSEEIERASSRRFGSPRAWDSGSISPIGGPAAGRRLIAVIPPSQSQSPSQKSRSQLDSVAQLDTIHG
jgi:hypothetical protein